MQKEKLTPEAVHGTPNSDIANHKKPPLIITTSAENFEAYITYSPVAVLVLDSDGKFFFLNEAACKLVGYSSEELAGMNFPQLLFREDYPYAFKLFTEYKQKGRIFSEITVKRKDGQPVNVIVNAIKLPDGNMLAFCENVTKLKKTENALKMSEAKFRSIVENSGDQIFMIDANGRYMFVNKSLADNLNKPAEDIIGKTIFEIYPLETAAQFITNLNKVFATGKRMVIEEKMTINNQEMDVSTGLNPLTDADGKLIAVTGIVRDLTERVKAERELRESEERFRVIFEGATEGILVADAKTQKFVLGNPQMCEMLGYSLEELLKMSVSDIHPKEIVASLAGEFEKLVTGEKVAAQEIPVIRADKTIIDCEITSGILEIWKRFCIVGFFRDVTERKQAEKKLEDSYQALGKHLHEIKMLQKDLEKTNKLLVESNVDLENYTYVVSHDLKAPLRAIRSFSTFILEDYSEKFDGEEKDYFQRIIDASTRMDELIENLLLLSRVGRKFMDVETVDLNQLLEEIKSELEPTIKKKNATVVFQNLPKVSIPRTWMKQLFMNLIDNGLKFNKSKTPKVEVTCEENDTEFLFKVSDNGIGIEEKYFDRLFNLFERLHTQEEYPGTGAGLAICKKIVQQFGGKIWVESHVGKGSTFFFTLLKSKTSTTGDA